MNDKILILAIVKDKTFLAAVKDFSNFFGKTLI